MAIGSGTDYNARVATPHKDTPQLPRVKVRVLEDFQPLPLKKEVEYTARNVLGILVGGTAVRNLANYCISWVTPLSAEEQAAKDAKDAYVHTASQAVEEAQLKAQYATGNATEATTTYENFQAAAQEASAKANATQTAFESVQKASQGLTKLQLEVTKAEAGASTAQSAVDSTTQALDAKASALKTAQEAAEAAAKASKEAPIPTEVCLEAGKCVSPDKAASQLSAAQTAATEARQVIQGKIAEQTAAKQAFDKAAAAATKKTAKDSATAQLEKLKAALETANTAVADAEKEAAAKEAFAKKLNETFTSFQETKVAAEGAASAAQKAGASVQLAQTAFDETSTAAKHAAAELTNANIALKTAQEAVTEAQKALQTCNTEGICQATNITALHEEVTKATQLVQNRTVELTRANTTAVATKEAAAQAAKELQAAEGALQAAKSLVCDANGVCSPPAQEAIKTAGWIQSTQDAFASFATGLWNAKYRIGVNVVWGVTHAKVQKLAARHFPNVNKTTANYAGFVGTGVVIWTVLNTTYFLSGGYLGGMDASEMVIMGASTIAFDLAYKKAGELFNKAMRFQLSKSWRTFPQIGLFSYPAAAKDSVAKKLF